MSRPTLVVVGATGAVGGVLLDLLGERPDVWGQVRAVASARSAGRRLACRGEKLQVARLGPEVFDRADVAMFDVPDDVAVEWAPRAAAAGAVVVDKSAAFRLAPDVPLVVPEVNPEALHHRPRGIVSSPNCTTLAMVVALGALHAAYRLRAVVAASYQAASGAGRAGSDALHGQLEKVAGGWDLGRRPGDVREAVGGALGPFPAPLALNVIPWVGSPHPDGWSSEEMKVRAETRKILGLPGLPVAVTCVRVPVVTGHSLAVHATFDGEVDARPARELLAASAGLRVLDDPGAAAFPTPVDAAGTDPAWVGRLRRSLDDPRSLDLFVCADNLRKGAALNAVQIAELLVAAEPAAHR